MVRLVRYSSDILSGAPIDFADIFAMAQATPLTRVRVLIRFSENRAETQEYIAAFAKALEKYGWLEGKILRID